MVSMTSVHCARCCMRACGLFAVMFGSIPISGVALFLPPHLALTFAAKDEHHPGTVGRTGRQTDRKETMWNKAPLLQNARSG